MCRCVGLKSMYIFDICARAHRREQPGARVTHGPTDMVLGTKPRSFARGTSALNPCATSPVSFSFLSSFSPFFLPCFFISFPFFLPLLF